MDGRRCVGIDVSAHEITVSIEGRAERTTLANDASGHGKLVRLVTRGKGIARVCLEATGIYHLDLALALHRAPRVEVVVVNPAAVRDFGRALMQRSKTDGVDADVLLAYAERMPFVAWQPPAPEILDLRAIVRRIGALTLTRTQERKAQWDAEKAAANLRKHGVDFADAETALRDESALTRPDDDPEGERFVTLGMDALGRLLVVVYEWGGRRREADFSPQGEPSGTTPVRGQTMKRTYDFSKAKRGPVIRTPRGKTRITIRIDDDVLEWFRKQVHEAGGGNYQTMMNRALREFMEGQVEPLEDTLRRVLREVIPARKKTKRRSA